VGNHLHSAIAKAQHLHAAQRLADQRPAEGPSVCIGMLAPRCRCVHATAFLVLPATSARTGIIAAS
jgi:hypothetical protein